MLEMGWSESEGGQILLSAGIGFMAGKYVLRAAQMGEYGEAEMLSFMNRLLEAEAEVASLRYQLFEMRESNKNWSHAAAALEQENRALRLMADQQRAENGKLQSEGTPIPAQQGEENKSVSFREPLPLLNREKEKPAARWMWLRRVFR
jgi:hypothetical protein